MYGIFLPKPYAATPTVYAMPPASRNHSPAAGIFSSTVPIAKTTAQPIAM